MQPYGTNDAGGFRSVLPPGENGVGSFAQLLGFRSTGIYPPHWVDQQPLYEGLVDAAPSLTDAQLPSFFKDATFGVPAGQEESTISPRPGLTIVRDSYGVPHVYGDTRSDVMYGAGYAGAADRLFLMDILRHTGRAELSSFVGGSAADREQDRTQWQFAPYTEADLQAQIDAAPRLYGPEGAQAVQDLNDYVAGINAYIAAAAVDPTLLPAEYTATSRTPQPWSPTDVVATASLIGAMFGKGGGHELDSAKTMQALVDRFGKRRGRKAWRGFREKNDPRAPTTISKPFPYETTNAFAKRGLAIPKRGTLKKVLTGKKLPESRVARSSGVGAAIVRAMREGGHASNWELVSAKHSITGHPLGVLGPQVGYYVPQILMEEDLHGPGIDARGAAFPGVNLIVQLGHGRDYAWSATTSTADNTDTFAEVLCKDKFHYRYKGKCKPMEKLTRTNSWTPGVLDSTPAGSETLTAYRTVHGILIARGKVHRKKVAYVTARTSYFHEADSVVGFSRLNDPAAITGPSSFKRAASKVNFLFNWGYLDSQHIAYYMSGALPRRAKRTSPDFPVFAKFGWKGFDPTTHTEKLVGFKKHPQAVDPAFMVSWNNKQAPKFAAADDQYAYGPIARSQMISHRVRRGTKGKRKMTLAQLVQAMELPATEDLRAYKALPAVLDAIGHPGGRLGKGLAKLRAWRKDGSQLKDLNHDGTYEHNHAIELMDAWWPRLITAEFKPSLGSRAFKALQKFQALPTYAGPDASPHAPDFFGGWWGYLANDLKPLFARHRHGHRAFCGKGSRKRCRAALRRSLKKALGVKPQGLYGHGQCAADPQPSCFFKIRPIESTAFPATTSFPFQNRPTFQQTVSIPRSVPR